MNSYCTNCGHPVNLRATACGDCGTGVSDEHRRLAALLPPAKQGQNPLAIASLVLAIMGLTVLPVIAGVVALAGSISAVTFGHLARRQLRDQPQDGSTLTIAGLILGYLGIFGFTGLIILTFWIGRFAFWF